MMLLSSGVSEERWGRGEEEQQKLGKGREALCFI